MQYLQKLSQKEILYEFLQMRAEVSENGKPFDIGPDVVRMGFVENANDPVLSPQQPPCQEQPIYDQPHSQGQYRHCLSRPFRQQFQDNAGTRGEQHPQ